jgi:hypothetical protein
VKAVSRVAQSKCRHRNAADRRLSNRLAYSRHIRSEHLAEYKYFAQCIETDPRRRVVGRERGAESRYAGARSVIHGR